MEFDAKFNVFKKNAEDHQKRYKDRYDPSKNYPTHGGTLELTVPEAQQLAEYLIYSQATDLPFNEYKQGKIIQIEVEGYASVSKNNPNNKYLRLGMKPRWSTLQEAQKVKEAHLSKTQQPQVQQEPAASLAKATDGAVVTPEDDVF
jgi:hypothetical protein